MSKLADQGINYKFTGDTTSLEASINRATGLLSNYNNALSRIGRTISMAFTALVGTTLVGALEKATKESINFVENLNLFNVVMDKSVDAGNKFVNSLQELYGMDPNNIMRYTAVFYQLSEAINAPYQASEMMSLGLTKLGIDMSSLFNIPIETVMQNLQSGMQGLTRAVRKYGVDLRMTTLDTLAATLGLQGHAATMTEADRQGLRYILMIQQTAKAQGDWAKTMESPANQLRILGEQMSQFGRAIGNFIITPLASVLPYINGAVMALREFLTAINALLGFKPLSFGGATDAANAITDSVDAAGNSADATKKKLQDLLAPFDELNTFREKSSTGSDTSLAGLDGSSMDPRIAKAVADMQIKFENIRMKANEVRDAILAFLGIKIIFDKDNNIIGYTTSLQTLINNFKKATGIDLTPLTTSLSKLANALKPLETKAGEGLAWLLENVFKPLAKFTIEKVVPVFLDLLSGALTLLNATIDVFKPTGLWLFDNFLVPIAIWTGGTIVSILKDIGTALGTIGDWMRTHKAIVEGITINIVSFFAAWKVIELLAFIQMSGGVIGAIKAITVSIRAFTVANIENKLSAIALAATYVKDLVVSLVAITVKIWEQITAWVALTAAQVLAKAETLYLTALYAKDFILSVIAGTGALIKQCIAWVSMTAAKVADKVATLFLTALYAKDFVLSLIAATGALIKQSAAWIVATSLKIANTVATVASTVALGIWSGIVAVATAAQWLWNAAMAGNPIVLVTLAIAALVVGIGFLIAHWDTVKQAAITSWNKIKEIWGVVATWFSINVTKPISKFFTGLWDDIKLTFGKVSTWFKARFTDAWTAIKDVFKSVGTFFSGVWTDIKDTFTGVGAKIGSAVGAAFRGTVNTVLGIIESQINGFIDLLNDAIKIIDLIPGIQIGPIGHVNIPTLAKGGVVSGPTIALLGEGAYKEAVIPLGNSPQIKELIASIVSAMSDATSGAINLTSNLLLDGEVIYTNQKKIERSRGLDLGMGVFAR